jgi:hypothetical protein
MISSAKLAKCLEVSDEPLASVMTSQEILDDKNQIFISCIQCFL